jgi:hypothetical protein
LSRYSANAIDEMRKLLFGYRDNMRVEVEPGVAVTAKTVADLRALPTWPDGLGWCVLTEPNSSRPARETTMFFPHFVGDACSREPLIRTGLIEALDY